MKKNIKKNLLKRLSIVEGQVRGLNKMVTTENYCVDIITQSSAVRQALSTVEDLLLENHLSTHVKEQMESGQLGKVVREISKIYKIGKKR